MGGVDWIARLLWRMPFVLQIVIRIILLRDTERVQKMILHDVAKTSTESFFRSIGDLHHTDLRPRLGEIKVPTMGIFGERDVIVHPNQSKLLAAGVSHARVVMLKKSGHFPMLDEPEIFNTSLLEFVQS
jgi:pimeloyl-ACP methyl ester carboxylesterase